MYDRQKRLSEHLTTSNKSQTFLYGKYYLEEEKILKKHQELKPNPEMRTGYKGDFPK